MRGTGLVRGVALYACVLLARCWRESAFAEYPPLGCNPLVPKEPLLLLWLWSSAIHPEGGCKCLHCMGGKYEYLFITAAYIVRNPLLFFFFSLLCVVGSLLYRCFSV